MTTPTVPAPGQQPQTRKWLIYGGLAGCGFVVFLGFLATVAIVAWLVLRPAPPAPAQPTRPPGIPAQPSPPTQPATPTPPPDQPAGEAFQVQVAAIGRGDDQGNLTEQTDTLSTRDRTVVAVVQFSRFAGVTARMAALWVKKEGGQFSLVTEPRQFDLDDRLSGQSLRFWITARQGLPAGDYVFAVAQAQPGGKPAIKAGRPFKVQ